MNHIADNQDALLDYLYEEGDPAERLMIAKHLQECAACSVAVLEFQNVRGMLSEWAPPTSRLGFRVVQDASLRPPSPHATVLSPSAPMAHGAAGGWWRSPSWLQAAAAVLLFVSGMAASQLRFEYRDGVVTVRMGSAAPAPRTASIVLPAERVTVASNTPAPIDLDAIERELRARLESGHASADTESLLQRVRAMIDQSEQRQQARTRQELALRLSQVAREVDTQHQADLLKIQNDFGQQQEATMNYLVRTSGGAK